SAPLPGSTAWGPSARPRRQDRRKQPRRSPRPQPGLPRAPNDGSPSSSSHSFVKHPVHMPAHAGRASSRAEPSIAWPVTTDVRFGPSLGPFTKLLPGIEETLAARRRQPSPQHAVHLADQLATQRSIVAWLWEFAGSEVRLEPLTLSVPVDLD